MKLKSSCHHHQPSRNELKVRPEVQRIFGRTSRRLVMCSNTLMNLRYLFNENWKSYVIWTTLPELLKMQHNYNYGIKICITTATNRWECRIFSRPGSVEICSYFFSTQPLRKVCIANRNIGQFCFNNLVHYSVLFNFGHIRRWDQCAVYILYSKKLTLSTD